jgi:hypothetical protein
LNTDELTAGNIFINLSLYNPIKFSKLDLKEVVKFFFYPDTTQFDCFCVECEKDSTFKFFKKNNKHIDIDWAPIYQEESLNSFTLPFQIAFSCQRNNNHIYSFSFRIADYEITKVGQYPSIASIESFSIQKYQKVLSDDYRDFSKAIGLYSHGIGAGSFVYLRRIFENLIEEKRREASQGTNWNEDAFKESRMDEKIKLLDDKLPSILVGNRNLYGILSKGIHELSEDECQSLFPDVKLAIELILDEKIYQQEQQKKITKVSRFVDTTVEKFNTAKS